MNALARLCWTLLGSCLTGLAFAHSGSASYIRLSESADELAVIVSLDLRDAEYAVGVDRDGDREITWGELSARHAPLGAYLRDHLQISRSGHECSIAFVRLKVDQIDDSVFAVLEGPVRCSDRGELVVHSNLMFELDADHRTLIQWSQAGRVTLAALTAAQREWRVATVASVWGQLAAFGIQGVRHIWSGLDHLAFLMVILLPAFIMRGTAQSIDWYRLLALISAFTVAHSVTLMLAVFGLVSPSERAIEIAIAASVIVAALTNLVPGVRVLGVPMAFAFGLLHGFGFASALDGLRPGAGSLAAALAGFNLGVEVGQIVVVAATFPLLYRLRTHDCYARLVVPACSLLVAVAGFLWVIERVKA